MSGNFLLASRWGSAVWFFWFRLVWAIYWFLVTIPNAGKQSAPFQIWAGVLPVFFSTLVAGCLGFTLGYSIVRPGGNHSYWKAGLKGFLIQHLTTILYIPAAVAVICLINGYPFLPSLYMSYAISFAGFPIHTLLGILTGLLYYHLAVRRPTRHEPDVQ